jgi:pilus assembly protein CpaB
MEFSARTLVVVITSFVLAGGVAWVGVQANNAPEPLPVSQPIAPPAPPSETYLFANAVIEQGGVISAGQLKSVEMQIDQAGENLIEDSSENRSALIQLTANRMIPMGTPFVKSDLQPVVYSPPEIVAEEVPEPPVIEGAAALLRSGMRAIALPLTGETAVAGLIAQGDRIDVLVSYDNQDGVRAVRTVLHNVQVLATDQTNAPAGQARTGMPKTITLELHPEGAKVLALAKHTGEIILVLSDRTGDDMPTIVNDTPMLATQISGLAAPRTEPAKPPNVRIIRGSATTRVKGILGQSAPDPSASANSPPPSTTGSD